MEKELNEERENGKSEKSIIRTLVTGAVVLIIIITGFIILLNKDSQITELHVETQKLDSVILKRDSVINELDGTIFEIEQNIGFVKDKREQLEFEYRESNLTQKARILEDIKLLDSMLEENEKKMEELNQKLASSQIELTSFRDRVNRLTTELKNQNVVVDNLKKEIERRDYQLTQMDEKVNQLETFLLVQNDSLTALSDSINRSSERISYMDRELNKAYWVQGTFKELKENEVLEKEGGFLGFLGKNKAIKKDLNIGSFTELDIRKTGVIPLNARKVKMISEHSANSYRFIYHDDLVSYLKIENPEEFWKLTRFAVIEVKQ
jgi:DNA repair exonuclease SbcCD ATPase subunit